MRLRCLALILFSLSSSLARTQPDIANPHSEDTNWLNQYAHGLGEQHTELGLEALQLGDYAKAERSLLDAIQVIKVNQGLYSTDQLRPLQYLIEAQLTLGEWHAAETQIEYFQWINVRNYRDSIFTYLNGTEALSGLLLASSANVNNPYSVRHLVAAKNLNWQAVNAIEQTFGSNSLELAPWLYRIVLNHYYQSTMLRRQGLSNYSFKSDSSEIVSGWTMRHNETLEMSYRIGKELLGRIQELFAYHVADHEQISNDATALMTIYQGDWELLFGNDEEALEHYRSAYQDLLQMGRSEAQVDRFFDRPVSLPAPRLQMQWTDQLAAESNEPLQFFAWSPMYPSASRPAEPRGDALAADDQQTALARFDLTPAAEDEPADTILADTNLSLDNLQILGTTPDNELTREQARVYISLLQFRPRLVSGMPVKLENIELEYLFPPQMSLLPLLDP